MDNVKVDEVLRWIDTELGDWPPERLSPRATFPSWKDAAPHLRWMAQEALTFGPERLEKKMRWLGFLQGALWSFGVWTIEELKRANMPDAEKK